MECCGLVVGIDLLYNVSTCRDVVDLLYTLSTCCGFVADLYGFRLVVDLLWTFLYSLLYNDTHN